MFGQFALETNAAAGSSRYPLQHCQWADVTKHWLPYVAAQEGSCAYCVASGLGKHAHSRMHRLARPTWGAIDALITEQDIRVSHPQQRRLEAASFLDKSEVTGFGIDCDAREENLLERGACVGTLARTAVP